MRRYANRKVEVAVLREATGEYEYDGRLWPEEGGNVAADRFPSADLCLRNMYEKINTPTPAEGGLPAVVDMRWWDSGWV